MRITRIILLLCAALIAAACDLVSSPQSPPHAESTANVNIAVLSPTPVSVSADKSAIVGKVLALGSGNTPLGDTTVRAGTVHWNGDKSDGAFVFDSATGPATVTQPDGTFAIFDLPPGDYALMVGDPTSKHEIISEGEGKARIYTTTAGNALDVGTLEVTSVP